MTDAPPVPKGHAAQLGQPRWYRLPDGTVIFTDDPPPDATPIDESYGEGYGETDFSTGLGGGGGFSAPTAGVPSTAGLPSPTAPAGVPVSAFGGQLGAPAINTFTPASGGFPAYRSHPLILAK